MKKQPKPTVMDERQLQINGKALHWASAFLALCVLASLIYDIVHTGQAGWELFALVGACAVFAIASRKLGDIQPPKDWRGNPMPTGNEPKERAIRKKNYATESIFYAAASAIMDVLLITFGMQDVTDYDLTATLFPGFTKLPLTILTAVIVFAVAFLISYGVEYLYGEKVKVKKYNQMVAALEAEEEE